MLALPTLLNAFTKLASVANFCSLSISESSSEVKKFKTPSSRGVLEIGLVVSMTVLPASCLLINLTTSSAAEPLIARTTISARLATSVNTPTGPSQFSTSWPDLLPIFTL